MLFSNSTFETFPLFVGFDMPVVPALSQSRGHSDEQVNHRALFVLVLCILAFRMAPKFTFTRPHAHDDRLPSNLSNIVSTLLWPFVSLFNTVYFLLNPKALLLSYTTAYGNPSPARMDLVTETVHLVQGKEHINRLWRHSFGSRSLALHAFLFKNWFAMPQKVIDRYLADDSGSGPKPHPLSSVQAQNRTDRLSHSVFKDVLSGPDTTSLCQRYVLRLCNALSESDASKSWKSQPDLMAFVQSSLTLANTEALWGTHLTQTSSFCGDLTEFFKDTRKFTFRLPRWLIPKAFARRERLLSELHRWQSFATEVDSHVAPWENNYYNDGKWGSKQLRKWQSDFLKTDDADAAGLASVHLTFAWAVNVSLAPAAFWAVLEIFRDPKLLERVRSRLPRAESAADVSSLLDDAQTREKICADALLQSIYAEILRLRVCAFVVRRFPHESVDLHGWRVPRDQICLVSTHIAHMHGDEWNTDGGKQPLDRFWASRFLVPKTDTEPKSDPCPEDPWEFSLRGLQGVWIPFGGGPRACPGRHLAKHHMLVTVAAMVMLFDMEITAGEHSLRPSHANHGLGTLLPVGKVPFSIRRRV